MSVWTLPAGGDADDFVLDGVRYRGHGLGDGYRAVTSTDAAADLVTVASDDATTPAGAVVVAGLDGDVGAAAAGLRLARDQGHPAVLVADPAVVAELGDVAGDTIAVPGALTGLGRLLDATVAPTSRPRPTSWLHPTVGLLADDVDALRETAAELSHRRLAVHLVALARHHDLMMSWSWHAVSPMPTSTLPLERSGLAAAASWLDALVCLSDEPADRIDAARLELAGVPTFWPPVQPDATPSARSAVVNDVAELLGDQVRLETRRREVAVTRRRTEGAASVTQRWLAELSRIIERWT